MSQSWKRFTWNCISQNTTCTDTFVLSYLCCIRAPENDTYQLRYRLLDDVLTLRPAVSIITQMIVCSYQSRVADCKLSPLFRIENFEIKIGENVLSMASKKHKTITQKNSQNWLHMHTLLMLYLWYWRNNAKRINFANTNLTFKRM